MILSLRVCISYLEVNARYTLSSTSTVQIFLGRKSPLILSKRLCKEECLKKQNENMKYKQQKHFYILNKFYITRNMRFKVNQLYLGPDPIKKMSQIYFPFSPIFDSPSICHICSHVSFHQLIRRFLLPNRKKSLGRKCILY